MGRRSNGEGTLYRDKSRRGWVFEQYVTLPDGSSRRIKARGKSQVAARERMAARIAELALAGDQTVTVDEWLERWLRHKEPLVKGSTLRGYRQDARLHIAPLLGPKPLARVTAWDVQGVVDEVTKGGRLVMADRVRRTLRQALGHAVTLGILAANPAAHVKRIKPPPVTRASWSRDQGEAFLRHTARLPPPWPALFLTAVATGMRKGELIALRRTDLVAGALRVRRNYTPHGAELFDSPKSRDSLRSIPIAAAVRGILEEHIAASVPSELLFPAWDGGPLNPRTVNERFGEVIAAAGLPPIRFHDLRRTYATWLLQDGVDVRTVQKLLGHSTPVLTLSVYADAGVGAALELGGGLGVDSPVQEGDESVRLGVRRRRRRRRSAE